MMLEFVVVE